MSDRITVHPGRARDPTGNVMNDPGVGPSSKLPLTTRFGTAIAGWATANSSANEQGNANLDKAQLVLTFVKEYERTIVLPR